MKVILYIARNLQPVTEAKSTFCSCGNNGFVSNGLVQIVNQSAYLPIKTNPVTSNTADNQECLYEPPVSITRPQFDIGDIVWAQARGLPSWPGKVVDASEVGKGRPDDGKVRDHCTSVFGTISQISV